MTASLAIPASRRAAVMANAADSSVAGFRDYCNLERLRLRRIDHHRQALDPGGPADRGGVRSAQAFDQPVVAAAGQIIVPCDPEAIGDELERGVAVIVEPANQLGRALPRDARRRRGRRITCAKKSDASVVRKSSMAGALSTTGRSWCALLSRIRKRIALEPAGLSSLRRRDAPRNAQASAARHASRVVRVAERIELQHRAVGCRASSAAGRRRRSSSTSAAASPAPMISASSWWNSR